MRRPARVAGLEYYAPIAVLPALRVPHKGPVLTWQYCAFCAAKPYHGMPYSTCTFMHDLQSDQG